MITLENKIDAVMRFITANDAEAQAAAKAEIATLLTESPAPVQSRKPESEIRKLLLELGVPDALKGHSLLVTAMALVYEKPDLINAVTTELYPAVAKVHDDTASRVERAIRHAIEVAWDRGDLDVLEATFGNTVSRSKGKPTNGEFIARTANVIRERMVA